MVVGLEEMSIKEMIEHLGLKNRESFMDVYLNPAIKTKYVRMLYPDKPRHPRQKYLLTAKGILLYNQMMKKDWLWLSLKQAELIAEEIAN